MIYAGVDIRLYSKNSVEANNLDALVADTLHDATLSVDGQSTLICRRVADMSFADTDEEGTKIYMVGGTYVIITDQQLT